MKLFKNAHLNHSTPFLSPTPLKNHLKLTHLAFSTRWILLRLATGCDEIMSFHWKLSSFLSRKSKTLPFEFPMKIAIFFSLAFRYLTLRISNEKCDLSSLEINYLTLWISNGNWYLFSLAYQISWDLLSVFYENYHPFSLANQISYSFSQMNGDLMVHDLSFHWKFRPADSRTQSSSCWSLSGWFGPQSV